VQGAWFLQYILLSRPSVSEEWRHMLIHSVTFQVLKAASMKMTVFWVVAPCSLVHVYRCFRGVCCLHHPHGDGGSKHLWNVGKILPDYMAQHPRRRSSSIPNYTAFSHFMSGKLEYHTQLLIRHVFCSKVRCWRPSMHTQDALRSKETSETRAVTCGRYLTRRVHVSINTSIRIFENRKKLNAKVR
jgi:hypothetical protein